MTAWASASWKDGAVFLKHHPKNQSTTNTSIMATNDRGQGASHASDSVLPQKVQEKVPKSVEEKVPDSAHDTGSNKQTGKVSHATGESKVPQALQEGLPESVEKAVPNALHDTKGAKFSDGSVGT
ncbi:hypothetical protein BDY17DRAFT_325709 [Neohortaea acidophila]|uniref:Uncharacterized protein n=1 Tax=Neohortaea acidophila TaxID=245834 RepID=A0A6A6PNH5_9PEZI|nr:uncharacterized protein BDY17DRAFT_325709 [Neohortaea acidophila]KAF2480983.1 hypothetical protein BDY17DRAFT_325709 [Neohortaea acidophila]